MTARGEGAEFAPGAVRGFCCTAASTQNSSAMTFPEFFNKEGGEFAKAVREGQPFKEIVRDQDKLYLRVASVFDLGQEKLTVVTE